MKHIKFFITLTIISTVLINFNISAQNNNYKGKKAKYIFYFIGDGMALSQTNSTEAYLGAINKSNGIKKLHMSSFPNQGFCTTYAENRFITGSAAAATALSTGYKTTINTISMDGKKQKPLQTIAEYAKSLGYKIGIVSSVSLDHATPACFYAHQPTRNMYYDISLDLSKSEFNYFGGGGLKHPYGDGKIDNKNMLANVGLGNQKENKDKKTNSIDIAKKRGYRIINNVADFRNLKKGDDKVICIAPRLAGGKALPYYIDQDKDKDLTLADFTEKGIELLNNKKGFFMMIEGGKIDWACHANDAATVINEVIQFDNAIKKALDFYKKHPKETLIVVLGDHETGGMALGFAGSHYDSHFSLLKNQKVSYEQFSKIIKEYKKTHKDNYKLEYGMNLVKKYFGLGDKSKDLKLSDFEIKQLSDAFNQSMNYDYKKTKNDQFYLLYGSYDPFTVTACHILSQKAGIGWTSFSHTASPVPIRTIGVGSEMFRGFYDNTDVPKKIKSIISKK